METLQIILVRRQWIPLACVIWIVSGVSSLCALIFIWLRFELWRAPLAGNGLIVGNSLSCRLDFCAAYYCSQGSSAPQAVTPVVSAPVSGDSATTK
jgi:hypothetical protein